MTISADTGAAALQPAPSFDALFDVAVQAHQQGRMQAAYDGYRALLARWPNQPMVLTNYALLLRQSGHVELGVAALRQCLAGHPDFVGALYSLGNAYGGMRDRDRTRRAFERVVALDPQHAYALNNLGNVHRDGDDPARARRCYRAGIFSLPDYCDIRVHLGVAAQQLQDHGGAATALRQALSLDPAKFEGLLNLGNLLLEMGRGAEAVLCYRRALRLNPQSADARGNYATALRDAGREGEAIRHYRAALAINPRDVNAYNNIGNALNYAGRPADAVIWYRRALGLAPDNVLAHFDLGLTLLHLGEYREGWDEYEWRWAGKGGPLRMRDFAQPQWSGERLTGKTLLVYAEQGMGDVIQMLRFLPEVARRVGDLVLEIQPSLMKLAPELSAPTRMVARGGALPPFDAHIPMLSLPRILGVDLPTLPAAPAAYLRRDPALAARWERRLGPGDALRVGLVWAGSATFKGDRLRSPRLEAMAPLLDVPGVRFYGLQMGDGRRDLESRRMPDNFVDLGPEISDFADTAAIAERLDLVISSCTAPAHVAAAVGAATWIILPFAADWRWLTERSDSPWYPSVRLFRQDVPGVWGPVVEQTRRALAERAALHASRQAAAAMA